MEKAVISQQIEDPARIRSRILASLVGCHAINDFYALVTALLLPAIRMSFGLSYSAVALVPFLSLLASAVLQPTIGYLADRRALRRVAMACGFGALALSMFGFSRGQSYLAVLVAAVCLGIGMSTYHPQSATLLRYFFAKERRGFAQGIHGTGNALGFLLAPVVIYFLLRLGDWHQVAGWLILPPLLGALIALVVLREPASRGAPGLLAGITAPLALLTVINGLALATSSAFTNWLPSYYVSHGFPLANSALLTGATSLAAFLAQPLGGVVSDRIGRRQLLLVALTGVGVSIGLFLAAPSIVWAIGLSLVVGFWSSLTPPVMMVYASELAPGERTGTAVGVVWGIATTISALALPLTGKLIDLAGGQVGTAYALLAGFALLAAVLSLRLPRG